MILLITNEERELNLDEQQLTVEQFNNIVYHPYIQMLKWDKVVVDLDDSINAGYLKQLLVRKIIIVPRQINERLSVKNVLTLITIYPESAAELLNAQKAGPEELQKVYDKLSETYNWKYYK